MDKIPLSPDLFRSIGKHIGDGFWSRKKTHLLSSCPLSLPCADVRAAAAAQRISRSGTGPVTQAAALMWLWSFGTSADHVSTCVTHQCFKQTHDPG